ncbi:hypothetical protein QNZ87_004560 [Vibrio parahaemolyticus]|nr:hypothetical protein [Vibrio parahaemolyticus]
MSKHDQTLDFYFFHKWNNHSTYRFLRRCLRYWDINPMERKRMPSFLPLRTFTLQLFRDSNDRSV